MYLYNYAEPDLHNTDDPVGHNCSSLLVDDPESDSSHYFPIDTEGYILWSLWYDSPINADKPITGVLCDWLQDHRDLLLSGAVGPNPAERLEQVIDWFRQHFERGSYAHAG